MGDVKVPNDLSGYYRDACLGLAIGESWKYSFVKELIERLGRAEQRVEEQKYFLHLSEAQHRSALDRCDSLEAENAALQREIAALRAPVTNEQFQEFAHKDDWGVWCVYLSGCNQLIESRASAQSEKGNGNG